MKIAKDRLRDICAQRGIGISELLTQSGVSKNAFYALARKKSILPRSITAIANTLNVSASDFMQAELSPPNMAAKLYKEIDHIKRKYGNVDPDNVRHTLLLLDEKPVERLRRALTRAQRFDFR